MRRLLKELLISANNRQPVIRGFFRRFGYGLTSIFPGESEKITSWILDAPRGYIFNHIGTIQRRFLTYLAQYLHIAKYASKNAQNRFFCNFSKSSEKVAYLQKKVCQNPQHRSRCRYRRRKIVKIDRQKVF